MNGYVFPLSLDSQFSIWAGQLLAAVPLLDSMKALVVDDEELAREEMNRLLMESGRFSAVHLAGSGQEALAYCEQNGADVVFLDVEMPGIDGFQLLATLNDDRLPVVLTTAHSDYAVRAFAEGVVDYLVKPVEPERLRTAIERVVTWHSDQTSPSPEGPSDAMKLNAESQVFLRDGDRVWLVTVKDIEMLETCGNYTKLFFPGGPALIRRPLKEFAGRLEEKMFFRINRERVINIRKIVEVHASNRGHLVLKMPNGETYEMSRHQTAEFQHLMAL